MHKLKLNSWPTKTTVEHLLIAVPSVHESTNCIKVLELFHENKKLLAIPIINDKDSPVGISLRSAVTEVANLKSNSSTLRYSAPA